MAVSLNSVISFNPTANYQQVTRANIRVLSLKVPSITSLSGPVGLIRQSTQGKRSRIFYYLPAAGGDNVATETSDNDSKSIQGSYSNNESSSDNNVSGVNSSTKDDKIQSSGEVGVAPQVSNGAVNSTNPNEETSAAKSRSSLKKGSPLTARERLRAARVLSRYTETKPSKPEERGNKLLEALQESTNKKGRKRSGLPEAPTNLLDDSKRGLPKQGWTINIIPGGMDVFLIIFSFVFISTVMFATTYIVWKVGAIHFNEY